MSVLSLYVSELLSVCSELESMPELSEESSSMSTSASICGDFAGGLAAFLVRRLQRNFWEAFFDNALFFLRCP